MRAAASTRFHVDLLHPGRVSRSWQDWVTGSRGGRRLALVTLAGALVLLAILFAGVLPASRRLAGDLAAVPGLTRDLAARDTDLRLLRSNLQSLSQEARRQVRWADVLTTLSQQTPPGLKLQLVEVGRTAPPAGASPPRRDSGSGGRGRARGGDAAHRGPHARAPGQPAPRRRGAVHGRPHARSRGEPALCAQELGDQAVGRRDGRRRPAPRDQHRVDRARAVTRRALLVAWVARGPRLSRAPGL